jgi:hypothetical protein
MLDACADMYGVCQLRMSTRMTSTLAQVLLAVSDKGNHTALTCLKELLTRTEWYAREAAIACIKKLSVACSCDIFDELGASCRCSIVPTMIELTQGDYSILPRLSKSMLAAVRTSLADICQHGLRFLRNACRGLAHCIDWAPTPCSHAFIRCDWVLQTLTGRCARLQ